MTSRCLRVIPVCYNESDEKKICILSPGQFPLLKYNHDEWEESYALINASSGDKEKRSQVSSMCSARNDCDSSGSNISNQILNLVSNELNSDGDSCACGQKSSEVVNLVSDRMDSDRDSSALGDKRTLFIAENVWKFVFFAFPLLELKLNIYNVHVCINIISGIVPQWFS